MIFDFDKFSKDILTLQTQDDFTTYLESCFIEFEEYLEKCRRLAFDFFNVQIPLPNTQTEFNF
mgnify:CR=1 FL=1